VNRGFADLRVEPLHHVDAGCPSRIRTSVHGSKVRCPTTRRRGSGPRKEEWSGRRDSNPRPSPWQGDALPTEPLPLENDPPTLRWCREPDSNWRHRDFQSRALPTELSRPDGQPAVGCPSAVGTIPRASRGHQRRWPARRAGGERRGRAGGPAETACARRPPLRMGTVCRLMLLTAAPAGQARRGYVPALTVSSLALLGEADRWTADR
jgi:hypothetical protein